MRFNTDKRPKGVAVKEAEIRVLCVPGMTAAMEELGSQFERTTGHKLVIRFALPSQLREPIDSGAFDVALLNLPLNSLPSPLRGCVAERN
jgi:ABC-type molybdate transport system substrate-binding protein